MTISFRLSNGDAACMNGKINFGSCVCNGLQGCSGQDCPLDGDAFNFDNCTSPVTVDDADVCYTPEPTPSPTTSPEPTLSPTPKPTPPPTDAPSSKPTSQPSSQPSSSLQPSATPSLRPSASPSSQPSSMPSLQPSVMVRYMFVKKL